MITAAYKPTSVDVAEMVRRALRRKYAPLKRSAAILADDVRANPKTAQNWLDGRCAPRLNEFAAVMARCEDLEEEFMAMVRAMRAENDSK